MTRLHQAAIAAVLCSAGAALAGNVMVQIECGNPPKMGTTTHDAKVVNLRPGAVDVREEVTLPIDGELDELWIDGRPLTLRDTHIKRGFVETAEFGRVVIFLSDAAPGYFVVMLPEQIDQLGEQVSGPSAAHK